MVPVWGERPGLGGAPTEQSRVRENARGEPGGPSPSFPVCPSQDKGQEPQDTSVTADGAVRLRTALLSPGRRGGLCPQGAQRFAASSIKNVPGAQSPQVDVSLDAGGGVTPPTQCPRGSVGSLGTENAARGVHFWGFGLVLGRRLHDLEEVVAAVPALPGNCGSHSADSWAWAPRSAAAPAPAARSGHTLLSPLPPSAAWQGRGLALASAGFLGTAGCLSSDFPSARLESAPGWAGGCPGRVGVPLHPGQKSPAEGPPASPLPRGLSHAVPSPDTCRHFHGLHLCRSKSVMETNETHSLPRVKTQRGGAGTRRPLQGSCREAVSPPLPPRLPGTGVRLAFAFPAAVTPLLLASFALHSWLREQRGAVGSSGEQGVGGRGAASPPGRRCRAGSHRRPGCRNRRLLRPPPVCAVPDVPSASSELGASSWLLGGTGEGTAGSEPRGWDLRPCAGAVGAGAPHGSPPPPVQKGGTHFSSGALSERGCTFSCHRSMQKWMSLYPVRRRGALGCTWPRGAPRPPLLYLCTLSLPRAPSSLSPAWSRLSLRSEQDPCPHPSCWAPRGPLAPSGHGAASPWP